MKREDVQQASTVFTPDEVLEALILRFPNTLIELRDGVKPPNLKIRVDGNVTVSWFLTTINGQEVKK